jgi:hypothetical protein
MTKKDKLLGKLLNQQSNFTYRELVTLLSSLGYTEWNKGKTSGSRRAFVHDVTRHVIRLHKPHPGNELKRYQKVYIIEALQKEKLI